LSSGFRLRLLRFSRIELYLLDFRAKPPVLLHRDGVQHDEKSEEKEHHDRERQRPTVFRGSRSGRSSGTHSVPTCFSRSSIRWGFNPSWIPRIAVFTISSGTSAISIARRRRAAKGAKTKFAKK